MTIRYPDHLAGSEQQAVGLNTHARARKYVLAPQSLLVVFQSGEVAPNMLKKPVLWDNSLDWKSYSRASKEMRRQ